MPVFDDLVDQERPIRLIKAALRYGNIPHAFLFTGLSGTGKKTAAMAFAMACNCESPGQQKEVTSKNQLVYNGNKADIGRPCGICTSCRKIIAGTHPDIHIVKPTGTIIKVEQIRSLCNRLTLKPNEASTRVVLIADAHLLNPEAGNTLLKTLEEPPDHTVFILTATQVSGLLPTIVSRCRHIRFNPISNHQLASLLTKEYGYNLTDASVIAAMAGGSYSMAKEMAETSWIKKRNWIVEQLCFLSINSIRFGLAFSETLSKNKQWLSDAFLIMKMWYRDLIFFQFAPENIVNKDLVKQIQNESSPKKIDGLLEKIFAVEQAERNILSNTNIRTTLDALVISLFGDQS